MKLDMHCHVKEGSIDSKVGTRRIYRKADRVNGYDGMVVTDHDTYNGYRYWKNECEREKVPGFYGIQGDRIRHQRCGALSGHHAGGAERCAFWRCAGCRWPC